MNKKAKVNILAFCTVILWASGFPLTKIAMSHFSQNALGFLRCTVAAILLFIIGKLSSIRKPKRKMDILWFFLSGGMGFTLYMIMFNTGIRTLTSSTSSIIIAVTPILSAIAASRIYKEKIKAAGWCMIALAFVGVLILLMWNGVFSINVGLIWTLGASVVFCGYNILNRKLSAMGYTTLEIITYSMLCGTLLLAVFSVQGVSELVTAQPREILAVIYLGVMPSAAAYFLWGKAMSLADKTSEVTNFMFVTPLLSTAMGFIFLREIPNAGTFIGGAIIISSIILFNLKGK